MEERTSSRVPDWVWVLGAALAVGIPIGLIIEAAFHNASVTTIQNTLIACGAALALFMIYLLWRVMRYVRAIERRQVLLSYQVHEDTGLLMKGHVRNVAMRVDTMTDLIETLARDVAGRSPEERLKEAGIEVGRSWSSAFANIRQRERRASSRTEQLALWSQYDATAGWGRFEFHLNDEGHGSVTLRNGFLSKSHEADDGAGAARGRRTSLEHFIAGYLETTISRVFGTEVVVTLDAPAAHESDDRTEFMVERPHVGTGRGEPPGIVVGGPPPDGALPGEEPDR